MNDNEDDEPYTLEELTDFVHTILQHINSQAVVITHILHALERADIDIGHGIPKPTQH